MTTTRRKFLVAGLTHALMFSRVGPGVAASKSQPKSDSKPEHSPEFTPESFKDHLGWWGRVEETEQFLGFRPKWFHCYHGWEALGWRQALSENRDWGQLPDKRAKLKPYPDAIRTCIMDIYAGEKGRKDPLGADLDGILAGKYNNEFRDLVNFYVSIGQSNMIWRLYHEMDLRNDRFQAYATPEKFKRVWRHIVELVRAMGNNQIRFQYSVNGAASNGDTQDGVLLLDLFYPGDAYVDRIAGGAYDRQPLFGKGWTTDATVSRLQDFAISHNKIFDLAECGGWAEIDNVEGFPGNGDNPEFVDYLIPKFMSTPTEFRGYLLWFNDHPSVRIEEKPKQLRALKGYLT